MSSARPGDAFYAVAPASQAYWSQHVTAFPGTTPGRNKMVAHLITMGVPRDKAREDWRHLMITTTGERPMTESETLEQLQDQLHESQAQQTDLATRLAKAEARIASQGRELDTLRQQLDTLQRQQAADHSLVALLGELRDLLGTNNDAWQPLDQVIRQDAHNGKGPLRQFLTTAVGRPPLKPY